MTDNNIERAIRDSMTSEQQFHEAAVKLVRDMMDVMQNERVWSNAPGLAARVNALLCAAPPADHYAEAFYRITKALGIGARPETPAFVLEHVVLPTIERLVEQARATSPAPIGDSGASIAQSPQASAGGERFIDIVFDGPLSHESGRFVEVENSSGASIKFGNWLKRPDGYWALRISEEVSAKTKDYWRDRFANYGDAFTPQFLRELTASAAPAASVEDKYEGWAKGEARCEICKLNRNARCPHAAISAQQPEQEGKS